MNSNPQISDESELGNLGAVLFDMDGTLVDSEGLWTIAMDRVARDLSGRQMSVQARAATVGASIPQAVATMLEDIAADVDNEAATARLLSVVAKIFAEELLWQPGAEELIDAVRASGLKTALVTNSTRSLVDVALGMLSDHRFDVTVCGDEVEHGKPQPDPYLRAMGLLGVTAADCIAVEDSPTGTQAAVAAGIPVLVVPSETPVPEGPGRVFASSLLGATVVELQHIHREFQRSALRSH